MDRTAVILWTISGAGVLLSLLLLAVARAMRRKLPPSCRRCLFPIDDQTRQAGRCPECGSDVHSAGRLVTRGRSPRLLRILIVLMLLLGLSAAGLRTWQLERKGELDAWKPSWLLAMQLGPASIQRRESITSELILRARAGMPGIVARSIVQRWKSERAASGGDSRFTPIVEELMPLGVVDPESIEAHTRGLLAFSLRAPASVGSGKILDLVSSVQLMGSTRLRFEIERARFWLDQTELPRQDEPTIIITDAGVAGSAASMSHATTNFIRMNALPTGDVPGKLSSSYVVHVKAQGKQVAEWTGGASAPLRVTP